MKRTGAVTVYNMQNNELIASISGDDIVCKEGYEVDVEQIITADHDGSDALQTVSILGTEYTIIKTTEEFDPKLENSDGYCDHSVKKIVIKDLSDKVNERSAIENILSYEQKVLRHEIIHAFLFESGIAYGSDWGNNEEVVDYFAYQFKKLWDAFQKANAI